MKDTRLKATVTNLISLVEQHATIQTLIDRCNSLWEFTGTAEQVKFMMECFYAHEQRYDIVIINSSNTYGLVDPAKVKGFIESGQVRRWDQ